MDKHIIQVPKGVEFISDWKDFKLFDFPFILNKKLTGCGFTQYALTCDANVILCSPRKILLENKLDWYEEKLKKNKGILKYEIFYAKNEYDRVLNVDKDLTKDHPFSDHNLNLEAERVKKAKAYESTFMKNVKKSIDKCFSDNKYCKILVTYDSYRKVKEVLLKYNLFDKFYVIIDEMQSIFTDASFKSTTELEFMSNLQSNEKVCYVSATPMMENYLDKIDEFKNLPYYELDWRTEDPSRVIRPTIDTHYCSNLLKKASDIIESYRNNNWRYSENIRSIIDDSGKVKEVVSKEAVFYMNSVKNICDIIKKCKLKRSECNILIADTPDNRRDIMKAFHETPKTFQGLGKVPMEDEMDNNKMFTFCTRTVYLGADFWSTNARSFVFSDSNIKCMMVDVYLDIPQILGRQRCFLNPWKNEISFYYRTTRKDLKESREDFEARVQAKINETKVKISNMKVIVNSNPAGISSLIRTYEREIDATNYKEDYFSFNYHKDKSIPVPEINKLVMISEQRAFDIRQVDYSDEFSLKASIKEKFGLDDKSLFGEASFEESYRLVDGFNCLTVFPDKMKYIYDKMTDDSIDEKVKSEFLNEIDQIYANYYRVLGSEKVKICSFRKDRIDVEYKNTIKASSADIPSLIYSTFCVGSRYKNTVIKSMLNDLYKKHGIKKTAKASDLKEYFEMKPDKIAERDKNGNIVRVNGQKIIKKK